VHDSHVGDVVLGDASGLDQREVARLQADRREAQGHLADPVPELAPGHRLVGVVADPSPKCIEIGMPPRGFGERSAQRSRLGRAIDLGSFRENVSHHLPPPRPAEA
jgi:hypothetical protein